MYDDYFVICPQLDLDLELAAPVPEQILYVDSDSCSLNISSQEGEDIQYRHMWVIHVYRDHTFLLDGKGCTYSSDSRASVPFCWRSLYLRSPARYLKYVLLWKSLQQ